MSTRFVCWTKETRIDTNDVELARRLLAEGKLHRTGGPAFILNDAKQEGWYYDGKISRLSGPAIYNIEDGDDGYWYINGILLDTKEVEEWIAENKINLKTKIGQMAFKLRWL